MNKSNEIITVDVPGTAFNHECDSYSTITQEQLEEYAAMTEEELSGEAGDLLIDVVTKEDTDCPFGTHDLVPLRYFAKLCKILKEKRGSVDGMVNSK